MNCWTRRSDSRIWNTDTSRSGRSVSRASERPATRAMRRPSGPSWSKTRVTRLAWVDGSLPGPTRSRSAADPGPPAEIVAAAGASPVGLETEGQDLLLDPVLEDAHLAGLEIPDRPTLVVPDDDVEDDHLGPGAELGHVLLTSEDRRVAAAEKEQSGTRDSHRP